MSDQSERERRDDQRRRRFRRGSTRPGGGGRGYSGFGLRKETQELSESHIITSRPIILAKPNSIKTSKDSSVEDDPSQSNSHDTLPSTSDQGISAQRPRNDSMTGPSSPTVESKQASYQILRPGTSIHQSESIGLTSLVNAPSMVKCIKLVDDLFQWSDMSTESLLMDQSNFLVIGVLGLHGAGKSTILSLLSGSSPHDSAKSYVFPCEGRDEALYGTHATHGIDLYVTSERVIFLDTQPVLSTSVLDYIICNEKKYSMDFVSPENNVEIQSLQMAAFLMSVCHVVLVVQDSFMDLGLLNLLLTAEIVKPATLSVNLDSMYSPTEHKDYVPHIVFVQNKAPPDYFTVNTYNKLDAVLQKFFSASNLRHSGSVSLARSECVAGLTSCCVQGNINLFVLPSFSSNTPESPNANLTKYQGCPSFESSFSALKSQLYSIPRYQLSHTTLSEKNWFNYAVRLWDQVRKSQIIAEYNRFLP